MGGTRQLIAAATLAMAVALGAAVTAPADTALWVHGATRGEIPTEDVLRRIPPGYTLQEVDYPAGLWPWTGLFTATGAQSIAAGVPALDAAIRAAQADGKVLVIGESLGSMVVDQELRNLAAQPDRPDPSQVEFQVIADPTRPGGLVSYLPDGWFILLTGTRQQPVAETPYNVTVIKLQYDAVASWPDRPWHLLSVINAIWGGVVYHGTDHYGYAAQQVINGEVPPENISTTVNSQGGVTTTYTIQQSPALGHLLEPFLPQSVAFMDRLLTPVINLGYSELTPDAGPHLAPGGRLVDRDGVPVFGRMSPAPDEVATHATPRRPVAESPKVRTDRVSARNRDLGALSTGGHLKDDVRRPR